MRRTSIDQPKRHVCSAGYKVSRGNPNSDHDVRQNQGPFNQLQSNHGICSQVNKLTDTVVHLSRLYIAGWSTSDWIQLKE